MKLCDTSIEKEQYTSFKLTDKMIGISSYAIKYVGVNRSTSTIDYDANEC